MKGKENGKRKKEKRSENKKNTQNISVERRTKSVVEKICYRCKGLYLSENFDTYTRCSKCGNELVHLHTGKTEFNLSFPQYGGKA